CCAVTVIGWSDLPSRLPTQSSTLYSNNITKFLLSLGQKDHFNLDMNDEVVRTRHSVLPCPLHRTALHCTATQRGVSASVSGVTRAEPSRAAPTPSESSVPPQTLLESHSTVLIGRGVLSAAHINRFFKDRTALLMCRSVVRDSNIAFIQSFTHSPHSPHISRF